MKDPQRAFGALERELIYYRDRKQCAECGADVIWSEAEIHHVIQHSQGGLTALGNGALVHRHCHPKGLAAEAAFAEKWLNHASKSGPIPSQDEVAAAADDPEETVEL